MHTELMAMKSGEVTIKRWKGHPTCRYRANYLIAGKLKRKGFRKKKDAEEWAEGWRKSVEAAGNRSEIADSDLRAIQDHAEDIAEAGLSLREAIRIALDYQALINRSIQFSELAERYVSLMKVTMK